jgi:hypothetical protein
MATEKRRQRREDHAAAFADGLGLADVELRRPDVLVPARCMIRSGSSPRMAIHVRPGRAQIGSGWAAQPPERAPA